MGVPTGFDMALTTIPYYRSTYVFVTRQNRGLKLSSFDELLLRTARVGVQIIGDDGVNTPPAHALARRGIITNVVGFTVYGDYREPNPPARIVEAVAKGDLDVAVIWGPLAGYFSHIGNLPLDLTPTGEDLQDQPFKFEFSISMGVQKRNRELCEALNQIIRNRRLEIQNLLKDYGVPLLPLKEKTINNSEK
jgi:mxaJ protein